MSTDSNSLIELLQEISTWGKTTTIILHGGSVFEFKGEFPTGTPGQGFYNLKGDTGFEGHINLDKIEAIEFQEKLHRGQQSCALVFNDKSGDTIFKIFVGRNNQGVLNEHQLARFMELKTTLR